MSVVFEVGGVCVGSEKWLKKFSITQSSLYFFRPGAACAVHNECSGWKRGCWRSMFWGSLDDRFIVVSWQNEEQSIDSLIARGAFIFWSLSWEFSSTSGSPAPFVIMWLINERTNCHLDKLNSSWHLICLKYSILIQQKAKNPHCALNFSIEDDCALFETFE